MPTPPVDDLNRLQHMLDAANRATTMIVGRRREDLDADDQLSLALQRLVEIIGEAATKVTPETCSTAPEIRWQAISGMRHRLIHAYFDVDLDILWSTITEDLPPLVTSLESLLETTSTG